MNTYDAYQSSKYSLTCYCNKTNSVFVAFCVGLLLLVINISTAKIKNRCELILLTRIIVLLSLTDLSTVVKMDKKDK